MTCVPTFWLFTSDFHRDINNNEANLHIRFLIFLTILYTVYTITHIYNKTLPGALTTNQNPGQWINIGIQTRLNIALNNRL